MADLGFFAPALPDEESQDVAQFEVNENGATKEENGSTAQAIPEPIRREQVWIKETVAKYANRSLTAVTTAKKNSTESIVSLALATIEKARESSSNTVWEIVAKDADAFAVLFNKVLALLLKETVQIPEKYILLMFLLHAFRALENSVVRHECLRIVSISVWHSLADLDALEFQFRNSAGLRKAWNKAEKKRAGASEENVFNEQFFLSALIKLFYKTLSSVPVHPSEEHDALISFCNLVVDFFADLLSQLPTRRYLTVLLKDHYFAQHCESSNLYNSSSDASFKKLVDLFKLYESFEIDNISGNAVSKDDATRQHYENLQSLQKLLFVKYRQEFEEFSLKPVSVVEQHDVFVEYFASVDGEVVENICQELGLRTTRIEQDSEGMEDDDNNTEGEKYSQKFLVDALARTYCRKERQLDLVNSESVYPTEVDLFGTEFPNSFESSHNLLILPFPKLNLQFLTLHDYLLRNFNLFRLETAYEIRQDIEDAIKRLGPKYSPDVDSLSGSTVFTGWARMAVPIERFEVTEVGTPVLGESQPSFVVGEISFVIGRYSDAIRREWDSLKRHDVLFLITIEIDPENSTSVRNAYSKSSAASTWPFAKQFGIRHIRGCMVVDVLDKGGKGDGDDNDNDASNQTFNRRPSYSKTLRVSLDSNQYAHDMAPVTAKKSKDIHPSFNILLRRKPQENNFKSVVEAIRDLMQSSDLVVPEWLKDVLLGYGDPASAQFVKMSEPVVEIDFRDTFLDWEHAVTSFPNMTLKPLPTLSNENIKKPPFVLKFPDAMFEALKQEEPTNLGKRKAGANTAQENKTKGANVVTVDTYKPVNMGPFPEDAPKLNTIRFTPKQVEAIHAGTSPGLTLVVGPPGTGKTDCTVQIISNIYHNFPNEKTLLITHSNQALNQLFEKIVHLDIDSRHILRLGHGMEELDSNESWGKYGRVNSFLEKRLALLAQVDGLAASLSIPGAHGYTCETAHNFFNQYVLRLWERYEETLQTPDVTLQELTDNFPFHYYFHAAPSPLFYHGQSVEDAIDAATGCFRHLQKIFTELEEIRAFELLRNNHDRSNYLLMKEAKIIALTCTHAALKRRELVALGFKYQNVIMEEAAQILEVETFIPLLLQSADPETGLSRLKRIVLVGDHHQLPPIVQNSAFGKYCNMEQSLFARLIRLGVPTIELDQQGRCRPELADLFRWNYSNLRDLDDVVKNEPEFLVANPGFAFEYQFVNVEDYQGKGETEPIPHFLQNLGEAEYVVATYQYMRLLGYPAEKISIITTYNGQKALIEDVLEKRCRWNPLFGLPLLVSTVDKFQGHQNDYILLSLVRSKAIGHIRDVRRLIVSLSRARLGLYVFGRRKLFDSNEDMEPAFSKLLKNRPSDSLWLRGKEIFGSQEFSRLVSESGVKRGNGKKKDEWKSEDTDSVFEIKDVVHMGSYVHQMITEQVEYMKQQKAAVAKTDESEEINEDLMEED